MLCCVVALDATQPPGAAAALSGLRSKIESIDVAIVEPQVFSTTRFGVAQARAQAPPVAKLCPVVPLQPADVSVM